MIRVEVNGEAVSLPEGATVAEAIDAAGVSGTRDGLAVAVDGEVVPRGEWDDTPLADGQRVEVLAAIQGGAGGASSWGAGPGGRG